MYNHPVFGMSRMPGGNPAFTYPIYQACPHDWRRKDRKKLDVEKFGFADGTQKPWRGLPLDSHLAFEKCPLEFDTALLEEMPDRGPNPTIEMGDLLHDRLMATQIHRDLNRDESKTWPPAPEVGIGGDGHGWVQHIESIFRAVSGVDVPAPSLS
jgi:hypothetical protein